MTKAVRCDKELKHYYCNPVRRTTNGHHQVMSASGKRRRLTKPLPHEPCAETWRSVTQEHVERNMGPDFIQ